MADKRSSVWCALAYPESLPENWLDILTEEFCLEFAVSPLHEFDVVSSTGELKKAHYHIIFKFPSLKSFEQVKEITDRINSPIPQRCLNIKSSFRYFIHLDNPEKYQYNSELIRTFGGFDSCDYLTCSEKDNVAIVNAICDFIRDSSCFEFFALVDFARAERPAWLPVLMGKNSYFITQYLKSIRYYKGGTTTPPYNQ